MPDPLDVWLPLPLASATEAAPAAPAPPAPVAKVDVGEEVSAYCPSPRCSTDRVHTVISMYEDEIRRVQCTSCGEVHAFRRPRGTPDAPTERATPPSWENAMSGKDPSTSRPYSIRTTYAVGDLVHHPVFEIGVVLEVLPESKIEVVFRDGSRILVHAR
jgi:hypothetical protein